MLRQIPRKLRLAIEFLLAVGVVVGALSADHVLLAVALGAAASLVLFLDLFGESVWNALSASMARNAVAQGVFAPPDPESVERERTLRASLRHLLTELAAARGAIQLAIDTQEYWLPKASLQTSHWQQRRWFVAEWPQLGELYESLHATYQELDRINQLVQMARTNRAARPGHGVPIRRGDNLESAVASIEQTQSELRDAIQQLEGASTQPTASHAPD
jgi:hypothetical protein